MPIPSAQPAHAPKAAHDTSSTQPVTVGFDLDMTLIDSRPGIRAVYELLVRETGTHIDCDLAVSRLGPPLEAELAHWFPAEEVTARADRYRALYPDHAIAPTLPMPGAREALAALAADGGRAMVVTAKNEPHARLHLDHLGLRPDLVVGSLWAEAKAVALREYGAAVYVGDHLGDMRGARTAGALAVGVTTGPCDADELRAAGADVVLPDLRAFAQWWADYRS
ncbi:HAD hydrolase-like protein [Streptomyces sp. P38-E01]|uniref:HAD hydrolase-like protein n=1 Tax=Streptomyces tardus TaxID=2780544 RepID=A0A949JCN6_9ACTN|nr:HAD hydrolase-like protein [Streptomyces tardus]MBU7597012.1 HAD hydrolase-like protein [Streptomyces tardus]